MASPSESISTPAVGRRFALASENKSEAARLPDLSVLAVQGARSKLHCIVPSQAGPWPNTSRGPLVPKFWVVAQLLVVAALADVRIHLAHQAVVGVVGLLAR